MTLKRLLLLLSLHALMQNCIPQTNVSGNKIEIDKISLNNSYGFVENKGQVHDQNNQPNNAVKYLLNIDGLNVQLKANSFSYDTYIDIADNGLYKSKNSKSKNKESFDRYYSPANKNDIGFKFHRIDVILEGATANPLIFPEYPSTDVLNYYTSDGYPSGITDIHYYKKITYRDIYPGIDMVFDINHKNPRKQVEYYFIVKPGADPGQIILHYKGALQTELKNNAIEITVSHGKLLEQIPASFIVTGSSFDFNTLKNTIDVRYKSFGNNLYGFNVPSYKPDQTLIIDPTPDLEWGTYYGGVYNDWGYGIAKDNNGNIFIAGATSNDGLATAGSYQSTIGSGYSDAILGKFNKNGVLQWLTYYGGNGQDEAYSIATDGNNVYITGWTFSTNAIATPGTHQPNKAGPFDSPDAFIAKFNNNGIREWGTYYGGTDEDFAAAAATDVDGNIFITGYTVSQDGIATPGAHQQVYAGGNPAFGESGDGYITKFNVNGVLQWGTYYGGGRGDRCHGIAIDATGNVLVAGGSNSQDHIASAIAYQNTLSGTNDAFIVKLSNDGVRLWGTYYGGSNGDDAFAVATDGNNNIYITGWTYSINGIATPGTQQSVFGGSYTDAFIAKFNPNGNRQWGTYYGGNGTEIGNAIITDQLGNIFITGRSHSTNNIVTPNAYQTTISGNLLEWTPFVSKFNSSGFLQWGTYYGSGAPADPNIPFSNGEGEGIITDGSGNVFICGATTFRNGVSTCGAQQPTCGGFRDIFVAKFNENNFSSQPSVSIAADITGSFCEGLPVTFKASTLNAGINIVYQWKLNGSNVGTNSDAFITNTLVNGDIINCVVTILQTPCNPPGVITSNNISATVSPLVSPSVTITGSANTICKGNTVVFTATVVNGGNSPAYQWKINGINTGIKSNTYTTTTLANGDEVSCVLTSSSNCFTSSSGSVFSDTITMEIKDAPLIILRPGDTTIPSGSSLQLIASLTGNVDYFSWNPQTGLSNPTILNPVATPPRTTTYQLNVVDKNGCEANEKITIMIQNDLFIPNAFTPNTDGKNDLFIIPPGSAFTLTLLSIYDRWGNEVFKTKNINEGWNGTNKGSLSPVGNYVYIIIGRTNKGEVILKGSILLVR